MEAQNELQEPILIQLSFRVCIFQLTYGAGAASIRGTLGTRLRHLSRRPNRVEQSCHLRAKMHAQL